MSQLMYQIDNVLKVCKERKIPISKLEKDLGFGNGYVKNLKKGLPVDRALKVADYLGVSEHELFPDIPKRIRLKQAVDMIEAQKRVYEKSHGTHVITATAYDENGNAYPIILGEVDDIPIVESSNTPPRRTFRGPFKAQAIDPEIRDLRNDINELLRQIEDKNQLTIIKGIISQFVNKEGANIG